MVCVWSQEETRKTHPDVEDDIIDLKLVQENTSLHFNTRGDEFGNWIPNTMEILSDTIVRIAITNENDDSKFMVRQVDLEVRLD